MINFRNRLEKKENKENKDDNQKEILQKIKRKKIENKNRFVQKK